MTENITGQELITEINKQYQFSKRHLDNVHIMFNRIEEMYRSYIDPSTYPSSAKVFDPRVFRVIETIVPRLVANEPIGEFYPVEKYDVMTAHCLNSMLKYDWNRADMFVKQVKFIKSMLIFGTAFGITYWDYKEEKRPRMKAVKENDRYIWDISSTEEVTVTVADNPDFEVLNIYDCFPDPNATCKEDMNYFILRTFRSLESLEAENESKGGEHYSGLTELKQALTKKEDGKYNGGGRPKDINFREHRRIMMNSSDLTGQDESVAEITVLRRFTRDRWVDIAPEYNIVLRDEPNPYFHGELPIVYCIDYPYPNELMGVGEIEPVERIQRAINAVLNQRLDNVQLSMNNMWKVRKNSGVEMHTLVSAPNNMVLVDDMNSVESLTVPDVTGATFSSTMEYLTAAFQNGTAINDYTIGVNNDMVGNKTATGMRLIQQEANSQFKLKMQLYNKMVVEEIANIWKDLRIQFTTERQKLRIVGKDYVRDIARTTGLDKVDMEGNSVEVGDFETPTKLEVADDRTFAFLHLFPEDIQPAIVGDYDFVARTTSETMSDPITLQQNFFEGISKITDPAWQQGLASQNKKLNYMKITEDLFDKLHIGLSVEDYIEEMPEQQEQPEQQDDE